mmetsp:Transcript_87388/g.242401  ORF Transcript_87388/g.242401 Transcript_87388/m.242401 type:complete len:131 (+) Transcript_87388:1526-1918(+)
MGPALRAEVAQLMPLPKAQHHAILAGDQPCLQLRSPEEQLKSPVGRTGARVGFGVVVVGLGMWGMEATFGPLTEMSLIVAGSPLQLCLPHGGESSQDIVSALSPQYVMRKLMPASMALLSAPRYAASQLE